MGFWSNGAGVTAILVALLASGGPTRAEVIEQPDWVARPTGQDLARYYPELAQRMSMEGHATLDCRVDAQGGLRDCQVTEVLPEGLGFAEAALRMAPLFHMKTVSPEGRPVEGGAVRIPLSFRLPKEPAGSPGPPSPPIFPPADPAKLKLAREAVALNDTAARYASGTIMGRGTFPMPSPDASTPLADLIRAQAHARAQMGPRYAEAIAQATAASLDLGDLETLVAFTKSPVEALLKAKDLDLKAGRTAIAQWNTWDTIVAAREIFCRSVACGMKPPEAVSEPAPKWLTSPGWGDIARAYPLIARQLMISGQTVLNCQADAAGAPRDCKVASESPSGLGFGTAALRLADRYRLPPGPPHPVAVTVAFSLNLPSPTPLGPPDGPAPSAEAMELGRQVAGEGLSAAAWAQRAQALKSQIALDRESEVDEATRMAASDAYEAAIMKSYARMVEAEADLYARAMSAPDLTAYLAFLRTPAGRLFSGQNARFNLLQRAATLPIMVAESDAARAEFCRLRACWTPTP